MVDWLLPSRFQKFATFDGANGGEYRSIAIRWLGGTVGSEERQTNLMGNHNSDSVSLARD